MCESMLLPADQGQAFMSGMHAMMPLLEAAGVTPDAIASAAPQTHAWSDPYGNTMQAPPSSRGEFTFGVVPATPASHIAAGGPPNAAVLAGCAGAATEAAVSGGRTGRTLQAHHSDESAVSKDSRAGSRRRLRAKTADPYGGRSESPLGAMSVCRASG